MEGRDRLSILFDVATIIKSIWGTDFSGTEFRGLLAVRHLVRGCGRRGGCEMSGNSFGAVGSYACGREVEGGGVDGFGGGGSQDSG